MMLTTAVNPNAVEMCHLASIRQPNLPRSGDAREKLHNACEADTQCGFDRNERSTRFRPAETGRRRRTQTTTDRCCPDVSQRYRTSA